MQILKFPTISMNKYRNILISDEKCDLLELYWHFFETLISLYYNVMNKLKFQKLKKAEIKQKQKYIQKLKDICTCYVIVILISSLVT